MTYESQWGLRYCPFPRSADDRHFYRLPNVEEALARLHYLVDRHARLGLVIGSRGSGKTALLEVFANERRRRGAHVAVVSLAAVDPREFLWQVAACWGLNPELSDSLFRLWRATSDAIIEFRCQRTDVVLLVDDAGSASREVLDQVTRLVRADSAADSRLTIVLAACERSLPQIGWQLLDMTELRVDLQPWESSDTARYLESTLVDAGHAGEVFDAAAVARVHELSRGVPRHINRLAELSLMAAACQSLHGVNASTVESVYHELSVAEAWQPAGAAEDA